MLGTECTQRCSSLCHYPYSAAFSVSCPNTRVVWTVLGLSMKTRMYISKLFLFFNIISLNTFIPAMLQRHYPVPVVVLRTICKIPLYSCNRLLIRRKTLNSEEEFEFGEERIQREPNLGNRVDVPTIHSADPLIFPFPKHFCGRVHCPDEIWFFSFANRVFSHEFFRLVWLKGWNNTSILLGNSLSSLSSGCAFLNSVIDAGECLSSLPSRFTPGESQYPLNSGLILVRGIVVRFAAEERVFCPVQSIRTGCSLISEGAGDFCARSIGTARSHAVPA